jgi:hypothetical protein
MGKFHVTFLADVEFIATTLYLHWLLRLLVLMPAPTCFLNGRAIHHVRLGVARAHFNSCGVKSDDDRSIHDNDVVVTVAQGRASLG